MSRIIGTVAEPDPVDGDASVFGIPVDAFHTVVTDLFRIQVTAVAFTAPDAFTVIQYTWTRHRRRLLMPDYTSFRKKRSSKQRREERKWRI